jgi:hypothetical protein
MGLTKAMLHTAGASVHASAALQFMHLDDQISWPARKEAVVGELERLVEEIGKLQDELHALAGEEEEEHW